MSESMIIQGRQLSESDLSYIQTLIRKNPTWHRTRLSREVSQLWDWRDATGRLKDMACRTLLLKLDRRGYISLPAPRRRAYNHRRSRRVPDVLHVTDPIETQLRELQPISIADARDDSYKEELFNYFLHHYHYLSFTTTVGENIKYLVFDRDQRPLGCLLFGSAAWSLKPRDEFIGWSPETRQANLNYMTNNTRFLILPWVHVTNLASHILGKAAKQLTTDWMRRYNHRIYMIETFVDISRFKGTCYQAANYMKIGRTTGRTRQDRYATIKDPVKDIYLYALCHDSNQKLNHERPRHSGS